MNLKKVLIVDDIENVRNRVIEEFEEHGVEVLPVSELTELEQHLAISRDFQIIILDWFFHGDTSVLAQVCLKKIRQSYFVPVLIWTDEYETYKAEEDDIKADFPEACLKAASKADISYADLVEFLNHWYETTPARLSVPFRRSIVASTEEALYTLAEHSEDDLTRGLKTLISLEDRSEIDMEHAVDVLLRLVGRAIYQDNVFTNEVKQTLAMLELQSPPETKKEIRAEKQIESRIKKLHMYYNPSDNIVRTG